MWYCVATLPRPVGDPAGAAQDDMGRSLALHLRGQDLSLRDSAGGLVIVTGKKKGHHPSPATVMRMLREHDKKTAAVVAAG